MRFAELLEKTGTKLSSEQETAVRSDRATLVSAGAGSGKTTVLSLRFVRLVLEGKAHADEILTLTFTKKAAAEMYDRIHQLLSLAAADGGEAETELREHFPEAQISTMDSFWAEIARTDSLRYGITRDFSILDDDSLKDMTARIADELEGEDGWMTLAELYQRDEILERLYLVALKANLLTEYSAEVNFASYQEIAERYRSMMVGRAGALLQSLSDLAYDESVLNPKNPSSKAFFNDLSAAFNAFNEGEYSNLPAFNLRGIRNKTLSGFVKDRYRPVIEKLEKLSSLSVNAEYVREVSKLIGRFLELLNREKRLGGLLTFQDTEALATAILLNNLKVRSWYKNRFKYIMVDEFQDNNATQRDLLYLLSERTELQGKGIPQPEDLDPAKLFFVGDEKQSIYAFRGADVSVFRSLKDDVARMNGLVHSLNRNFRSEPALIDHFNKVFSEVFKAEEDPEGAAEDELFSQLTGIRQASYEAEYEEITARPAKDVVPSIRLAVMEKEKREDDELTPEESEASYLADCIKQMVRGDSCLLPGGRRPHYSDIAVLVRVSGSQLPIERIFRIRNIPYVVLESSAVTIDGPASDIYSFLQILLYPEDRLSYLAVLRSPFVRLSDKALLSFADGGQAGEAFSEDPPLEQEADREAYRIGKELYLECRSLAGRVPVCSLISTLWHKSGYHAWLSSNEDLCVFEEHYKYLWCVAEKFDREGKGLSLYLDYLRPMVGHSEKLKDISLQHFSSDSVQVMTIHKSKGLQFPIVIIPDLDHGSLAKGSKVVSLPGAHPYLMISPKEPDPVKDLIDRYARRREDAEKKRVLYVAATRAESHLLVSAAEKQGKGMLGLYRKGADEEADMIPPEFGFYSDFSSESDFSYYDKPVYERGVSGSLRIGVRDYAEADNSMLSGEMLPALKVDELLSEYGIYTDFGVMVHEALEAKLSGFKPRLAPPDGLSEEDGGTLADTALSIADGFVRSEFYKRYVEGHPVETEVRFYYPEGGLVLEGVADLLVFDDSGIMIIDYKTDRRRNPEQHRGQLENYAKALSAIYSKPCRARLCYVRDFSEGIIL